MTKITLLLTTLCLTLTTQAVEFEFKQKFKHRDSMTLNSISDDFKVKNKKKNRIVSQTRFVAKFPLDIPGLTPYIQLGYEWEKSTINQNIEQRNCHQKKQDTISAD